MGATATAVAAVAAVVGAGAAVYSAVSAPKPPDIPPPPPPASYYSYDEYGEAAGEQVWDASRNAYVYKPKPLTEEQKQELAVRQEIRNKNLGDLNKTPEEWEKAADEYAKTFSDAMHTDVDKRYDDRKKNIDEEMEARGLFGSRAYIDKQTELDKEKADIDTDIAQKATLAKEDLTQRRRDVTLRTIAEMDAGKKTDAIIASQNAEAARMGAQLGTASLMGAYNIDTNNTLRRWEAEMERNKNMTNKLSDTASGLAFLYGYNKGGSKGVDLSPPKTDTSYSRFNLGNYASRIG